MHTIAYLPNESLLIVRSIASALHTLNERLSRVEFQLLPTKLERLKDDADIPSDALEYAPQLCLKELKRSLFESVG